MSEPIRRRLRSYWKMEAGCAFLIPATLLWLWPPTDLAEAVPLVLALLPAVLLLLLGASYWRAALKRAEGDPVPLTRIVRIADRVDRPAQLLVLVAAVAAGIAAGTRGWTPPIIAAAACAVLAALEYLNYYRVQIQNFDHGPDLKRLIARRRLRRAHLARDLASFRTARK
jgi:hypothetical protein